MNYVSWNFNKPFCCSWALSSLKFLSKYALYYWIWLSVAIMLKNWDYKVFNYTMRIPLLTGLSIFLKFKNYSWCTFAKYDEGLLSLWSSLEKSQFCNHYLIIYDKSNRMLMNRYWFIDGVVRIKKDKKNFGLAWIKWIKVWL